MSLRTRLILAFVLLSVVPLSAVTLYSYSTSVHAFQRAVEREAQQSAADIGHRMTMVTDDLGRRMDQMFEGTSGSSARDAQPATSEEMRARVAPALGDAAVLVERVEFEPTAPPLPPTSTTTAGAGRVPPPPGAPPPPPVHGTPPVPPADAAPPAIVVDMGALLSGTQKGLEAMTAFLPAEAQAQIKAEMAKAVSDSIEAKGHED